MGALAMARSTVRRSYFNPSTAAATAHTQLSLQARAVSLIMGKLPFNMCDVRLLGPK